MVATKPEYFAESSSTEEESEQKIPNNYMEFSNSISLENLQNGHQVPQVSPGIQRKIKALKKLQLEAFDIEAKYFAEVHALECKYHKLYAPIYEKRHSIVTGDYEPLEEESQWPSDDDDDCPEAKTDEETNTTEIILKTPEPDPAGVPNFWLTIFQNVSLLSEMVQPPDEPILGHLQDITVDSKENSMSFLLSFHFSPNKYFTNSVLTKEYFMRCQLGEDYFSNFDGPEIYKCRGCTINWNKGMNVTLQTVKKKLKHRSRGVARTIIKTVPTASFFNFFSPLEPPRNAKIEEINELRQLLSTDFEIGYYIKERIVPRAVLFYTGEAIEDELYEDDDHTSIYSDSDEKGDDEAAKDAN